MMMRGAGIYGFVPGYWRNETSGVLQPAIETYLQRPDELTPEHIAAIRAYCRQWVAGDAWGPGPDLDRLRAGIDGLTTRAAIDRWMDDATNCCMDPL